MPGRWSVEKRARLQAKERELARFADACRHRGCGRGMTMAVRPGERPSSLYSLRRPQSILDGILSRCPFHPRNRRMRLDDNQIFC